MSVISLLSLVAGIFTIVVAIWLSEHRYPQVLRALSWVGTGLERVIWRAIHSVKLWVGNVAAWVFVWVSTRCAAFLQSVSSHGTCLGNAISHVSHSMQRLANITTGTPVWVSARCIAFARSLASLGHHLHDVTGRFGQKTQSVVTHVAAVVYRRYRASLQMLSSISPRVKALARSAVRTVRDHRGQRVPEVEEGKFRSAVEGCARCGKYAESIKSNRATWTHTLGGSYSERARYYLSRASRHAQRRS
jgi:hypothetical protein